MEARVTLHEREHDDGLVPIQALSPSCHVPIFGGSILPGASGLRSEDNPGGRRDGHGSKTSFTRGALWRSVENRRSGPVPFCLRHKSLEVFAAQSSDQNKGLHKPGGAEDRNADVNKEGSRSGCWPQEIDIQRFGQEKHGRRRRDGQPKLEQKTLLPASEGGSFILCQVRQVILLEDLNQGGKQNRTARLAHAQ
jgi:hypothetical protein